MLIVCRAIGFYPAGRASACQESSDVVVQVSEGHICDTVRHNTTRNGDTQLSTETFTEHLMAILELLLKNLPNSSPPPPLLPTNRQTVRNQERKSLKETDSIAMLTVLRGLSRWSVTAGIPSVGNQWGRVEGLRDKMSPSVPLAATLGVKAYQ